MNTGMLQLFVVPKIDGDKKEEEEEEEEEEECNVLF